MFRKALTTATLTLALASVTALSAAAAPIDSAYEVWESLQSIFQTRTDVVEDDGHNRLVPEVSGDILEEDDPAGDAPDNTLSSMS